MNDFNALKNFVNNGIPRSTFEIPNNELHYWDIRLNKGSIPSIYDIAIEKFNNISYKLFVLCNTKCLKFDATIFTMVFNQTLEKVWFNNITNQSIINDKLVYFTGDINIK